MRNKKNGNALSRSRFLHYQLAAWPILAGRLQMPFLWFFFRWHHS